MKRRIAPAAVKPGMYVESFGGSWFQHPFWRTCFLIETEEDARRIRESAIPFVEIDEAQGISASDDVRALSSAPPARLSAVPQRSPLACAREPYSAMLATNKAESDRKEARALVNHSKKIMRNIFERARRGEAPEVAEIEPLVEEITRSVSRNAQALLSVVRLKNKNEYTYFHSVAVCTLMVNMACHLGLNEREVHDLGMAGLLHDLGKMGVDETILNKPGRLDEGEYQAVRGHPAYGHGLLADVPGVPEAAMDVCLHHHEKMDGTGYPDGLAGEQISRAARMGAICDVYDALTSDRPYKAGWSPVEALTAMWSWEGHFDRRLLFALMQCLGVFPAGMLVRLRSNRLGIMLETQKRNTRPRACAFYCVRDHILLEPEIVIIRDDLSGDQVVSAEEPQYWSLVGWEDMSCRLLRGEDLRDAA